MFLLNTLYTYHENCIKKYFNGYTDSFMERHLKLTLTQYVYER